MRSSLGQAQHVLERIKPALLPILTLAACTVPNFTTPVRHSLLDNAIAWFLVCGACCRTVGVKDAVEDAKGRKHCLLAAVLYAIALGCDRAANDRQGLLGPQALLPFVLYVLLRVLLEDGPTSRTHTTIEKVKGAGFRRLLLIVTGTGLAALSCSFVRFPVTALGLSSTLLKACALLLLENSLGFSQDERDHAPNAPNGLLNKPAPSLEDHRDNDVRVARAFAAVVVVVSIGLSVSFESLHRYDMIPRIPAGPVLDKAEDLQLPPVKTLYNNWNIGADILGIIFEAAKAVAMLLMVRQEGSFSFSLLVVGGALIARVIGDFTTWVLWLAIVYALATLLIFDESPATPIFSSSRKRMRARQAATLCAGASLVLFLYMYLTRPRRIFHSTAPISFPWEPPIEALGPLRQDDLRSHPIDQLVRKAETEFTDLKKRQSQTLEQAVTEYRRRYGIPPPPKFDMWFEFAKRRDVQLIDEFDTIFEQLQPFWGLEPKTIRARVAEAIGYDNMLLVVMIRDGEPVKVSGGAEWQQDATVGMMKEFLEHLPDMNLAFNIHDEPRVIVPADRLAKLVQTAQTKNMPAAAAHKEPENHFSPRPADVARGSRIPEVRTTRFNKFAHQHTWTHSRASCSADSPARDYDEVSNDNVTAYAYGDLGFVYNHTAFTDICNSPSFRETFGFFDRPNAFNIVQDLFPIFSQSKISSYQDILYPSPWYWAGKVEYQKSKDIEWDAKENELYWRGSTTGGFSRNGGWRRQHRQRVVRKINAPDRAKILANRAGEGEPPHWASEEVERKKYDSIMDVKFSHIGQCDPGDCDAQRDYFEVAEKADQQDAWKYKYLLDMDGNAFSGRFYAFLQSNSLVYKMNVFQEWHKDWLKPWVHFIPMSLKGDEWLESVRYFAGEPEGKIQAPRMAFQGKEWAGKTLRKDDFEVWFFRLLLEYARLIDDNRESIGYPGP